MTHLVDSDWVADYLRGCPPAVALLNTLLPKGLAISIITYAEVYEGIHYGSDPKRHQEGFRDFQKAVRVLSLTRAVARRYAILRGQLVREGRPLDQPDLFIAATALHYNLVLVTRNRRHFDRIPQLELH